jgi:colanic acid biosynthesis protein WcaH
MSDHRIPPEEWQTIVANVPLVSVDLVIEHDGGVLLGKRENEPVKGEWFLPGGRVHKNERRIEAVHRVSEAELGADIAIDEQLGTFEHFYETSDVPDVDSKHYLATAYRCHFQDNRPDLNIDEQHSDLRVFRPPFGDFHPYVEQCLDLL